MPDLPLPSIRTFGAHLIAGIHRSPSKVGSVWNAHNCIIHGDGCPRSHYKPDTGTRIVGPDPNEGDQPAALLTLQGIGVTVRDLGFSGAYPIPTGPLPDDLPVGLSVKLVSGTGKMHWSHLDFRWLKTGVEIGGDTANGNCDQIRGEQLYFHDCGTAWHVRHSQAMLFDLSGVEVNNCGVGFYLEQGCNLRAQQVVFLSTPVGVQNGLDNPSVGSVFDHVAIDANPPGKRMTLFQQPKYGRSNFTFRNVQWPKGHAADLGQPVVETNHGARIVFLDSVLPAVNLVSILDGGTASSNAMPAVVEFHRCGFWTGWSPTKAFPMTQRLGKFCVLFRDCYDRDTNKPLATFSEVIAN